MHLLCLTFIQEMPSVKIAYKGKYMPAFSILRPFRVCDYNSCEYMYPKNECCAVLWIIHLKVID